MWIPIPVMIPKRFAFKGTWSLTKRNEVSIKSDTLVIFAMFPFEVSKYDHEQNRFMKNYCQANILA